MTQHPDLGEQLYCARGEMKNRTKEQQLDLFADRTSAHTMLASQAEGLTQQEIAVRFWGRARVEAEYYTGGWMHERVKRRLSRARAILKHYRSIATGA